MNRTTQDEKALAADARAWLRWLDRRARTAPGDREAWRRALSAPGRALWIGLLRLFRDHWDVGVFDLVFGCVKAFGIYPALFRSGLAWTIPLMEYAPLNTQLWTAGYLLARGRVASWWGRHRYGVELRQLDALRGRLLQGAPGAGEHVFQHEGRRLALRVESSRLRALWRRVCGRAAPGSMELRALRACLGDPELVHQAGGLRVHDRLYERVLLEAALRVPAAARQVVARARILPLREPNPLEGLVILTRESTRARIALVAHRHAARVRRQLPYWGQRGLALRWLGWSYQRAALRAVTRVEALEYALLAELECGDGVRARRALAHGLEQLDLCVQRLSDFALRARRQRTPAERDAWIADEIVAARELGLGVRLARVASCLGAQRVLA